MLGLVLLAVTLGSAIVFLFWASQPALASSTNVLLPAPAAGDPDH